jgi:hypothetical protein
VPDADHDERHGGHGALGTKHVDEDLDDGLSVGGVDGSVEVLDAEEQAEKQEEAED